MVKIIDSIINIQFLIVLNYIVMFGENSEYWVVVLVGKKEVHIFVKKKREF